MESRCQNNQVTEFLGFSNSIRQELRLSFIDNRVVCYSYYYPLLAVHCHCHCPS